MHIQVIWLFNLIDFRAPSFGDYEFPSWSLSLGWALAATSILPIPIWAIIKLCTAEGANITKCPCDCQEILSHKGTQGHVKIIKAQDFEQHELLEQEKN